MEPIETSSRDRVREHREALDVLRTAKNAFLVLAAAAVLLHLASWLVVQFGTQATAGEEYSEFDDFDAYGEDDLSGGGRWTNRMGSALVVAGFAGFASVLVLLGIFVVSLLVSLSSGLGGAAPLARAAVWSLAAMALVMPWVRIVPAEIEGMRSVFTGTLSVIRFGLCPVLALACLFLAQHQFRSAYLRITSVPAARLPILEV